MKKQPMPSRPNTPRPRALGRTKAEAFLHSTFCLLTSACALALVQPASAANIAWVSDAPPEAAAGGAFYPAGTGYTDSAFVTLLQNAGHNLIRFNGPNGQATRLSAEELTALNTNDLIIIGRAAGSGAWQQPQASDWNTNITKPLICMSPYLVRTIAANRMGWFRGDVGPDNTPSPLNATNVTDGAVDYIFGGVAMNGTNTAEVFDVPVDRNISYILTAPVVGGVAIATSTFAREDNAVITTGYAIAGFPVGTVVGGGSNILSGYRMYFGAGSRESAAVPNAIPLYTGRENLTATGNDIFLRSVQIALNSGTAPATDPNAPVGVTSSPASVTVLQGQPATFSVSVTGAAPRSLQWQRDTGDGVTFTNIPEALSIFAKATYFLTNLTLADHGAAFRVEVSNPINTAYSEVAVLTVTADTNPPVALSAGSVSGSSIVVCFNERVGADTAGELGNYVVNGGTGPDVLSATIRPDGKSVALELTGPIGATATVDVFYVGDLYGNVPEVSTSLVATNLGLTGVDVGALNPSNSGTNVAYNSQTFQVSGGGLDLGSTADVMRFLYKEFSGDFDARVRVNSLVGTNDHFETTTKAVLAVRESAATGARAINVFVTPPPIPYDNSVSSSVRSTAGAATNSIGASYIPGGPSNTWMRITRAGDLFTTYRSTNGMDWVAFGSATVALGTTPLVGVGVASHRNGKVVTGTFSEFRIDAPSTALVLTNSSFGAGLFSASFPSQNGVGYTVQFKDNLNLVPWNLLTNLTGDGTLKSFTDFGPLSPTGSRFYRVSTP